MIVNLVWILKLKIDWFVVKQNLLIEVIGRTLLKFSFLIPLSHFSKKYIDIVDKLKLKLKLSVK